MSCGSTRNRCGLNAFALANSVPSSNVLRPVLLAPAQFGVPADYEDLRTLLEARGYRLFVAPLTRFDWYDSN